MRGRQELGMTTISMQEMPGAMGARPRQGLVLIHAQGLIFRTLYTQEPCTPILAHLKLLYSLFLPFWGIGGHCQHTSLDISGACLSSQGWGWEC